MADVIYTRNNRTNDAETIVLTELTKTAWGFRFFAAGELEAYKAAYHYRESKHGVKVEFANGANRWMVTVFNKAAKSAGISGAK